jgi:hemolysin III
MKLRDLSHLDSHERGEEIANTIIHGVGAGLSATALALLVTFASFTGDPYRVVSFALYGATLVILFTASTLYHGLKKPRLKRLFRIFDHAAVYLLIAGTYTPFLLVSIRGAWGWSFFGGVWGLAILGVLQAALFLDRLKILALITYLGMGWLILIAIIPLIGLLPLGGFVWLTVGGACYTLGFVFYVIKRIPFNHAVWHVFVLAGAISHFFAMWLYVLPRPPV